MNMAARRVLVTGASGYIGGRLVARLVGRGHEVIGTGRAASGPGARYYCADVADGAAMRDIIARERPEAVVHLAALVHGAGKGQPWSEWQRVNVDASYALALAAREGGARWFLLMSSLAVYPGTPRSLREGIHIDARTPERPATPYGRSKLDAERAVGALARDGFAVMIARPPIVYGKSCPGNYRALRKIALALPAVPAIDNRHSMLHIDGLTEFIARAMEAGQGGLRFPQDGEYMTTARLMAAIRARNGRKPRASKLLALAIRAAAPLLPPLRKAFGSLTVDKGLSGEDGGYLDFEERMDRTEGGGGGTAKASGGQRA